MKIEKVLKKEVEGTSSATAGSKKLPSALFAEGMAIVIEATAKEIGAATETTSGETGETKWQSNEQDTASWWWQRRGSDPSPLNRQGKCCNLFCVDRIAMKSHSCDRNICTNL